MSQFVSNCTSDLWPFLRDSVSHLQRKAEETTKALAESFSSCLPVWGFDSRYSRDFSHRNHGGNPHGSTWHGFWEGTTKKSPQRRLGRPPRRTAAWGHWATSTSFEVNSSYVPLCSSYVPAMNGDYLVDWKRGYACNSSGIGVLKRTCRCNQIWWFSMQVSSIALSLFIAPRRLQKLWMATAKRWIHWLLLLFYQPFLPILENGISSQQSSKPQGILPFSQHRPGKKSSIYSPSPTYCQGSRTEAADHLSDRMATESSHDFM